jgi:hypothetical protein
MLASRCAGQFLNSTIGPHYAGRLNASVCVNPVSIAVNFQCLRRYRHIATAYRPEPLTAPANHSPANHTTLTTDSRISTKQLPKIRQTPTG